MDKTERRIIGGLELREAGEGAPQLVGYAAKFDVWSEDLGGFREKIAPNAFDRALREAHDVRALVNHDPSLLLGRTESGTLRLSVDSVGLRMELDLPGTQVGRDTATSVGRGDMNQMSFGFRTLGDAWNLEPTPAERTITDVELFDVSIVTYPAYPQTDVALRNLDAARAASRPVVPTGAPERAERELQVRERALALDE